MKKTSEGTRSNSCNERPHDDSSTAEEVLRMKVARENFDWKWRIYDISTCKNLRSEWLRQVFWSTLPVW